MNHQFSSGQIERFKKELLKLKNSLTKDMSSHQEDLIMSDQEIETYVEATSSAQIRNKQAKLLAAIELALLKIEQGTYGICEITDEAIPLKRLEIIPYATCTIKGEMIRDGNSAF